MSPKSRKNIAWTIVIIVVAAALIYYIGLESDHPVKNKVKYLLKSIF